MKRNNILLSILILLVLVSCKTSRTATKTGLSALHPVAELIEKIQNAQPQFTTANVSKMSLALDMGDRKINVSATCKMHKDSAMHISIQPFMGIEMFKAEFSTDSIIVFDKMNRRYYTTHYSYFSERFGVDVDFYSLQALISNQFFCIGKKDATPEGCLVRNSAAGQLIVDHNSSNMQQSTEISATNRIQSVVLGANNYDYKLKATYSDFTLMNTIIFPQKIALLISNSKNNFSCDFSILKAEFNTEVKLPANSTDRYTRGDIEQLLKK